MFISVRSYRVRLYYIHTELGGLSAETDFQVWTSQLICVYPHVERYLGSSG